MESDSMFTTLSNAFDGLRVRWLYRRSRYRKPLADMPAELFAYWQRFAPREFPAMPTDALFFARAAQGLMSFFDCVNRSGRRCALPSKAADSVWHAWAKLHPLQLERFCIKHFERPIPHIDAAAMRDGEGSAVANCLVAARRIEALPPAGARIPSLFSLDRRLRMPRGFDYTRQKGRVGFRFLGDEGRPAHGLAFPAALAAPALLAAGLVSREEYRPYAAKSASAGSAGSGAAGCGSSAGDRHDSCDTAADSACDGGGDSGGDGGGCGGGCGGGGGGD